MEPDILVVDLDEPGATRGECERFVNDHLWSRRIGVFDHFDARRAALAFELGCVAVCPFDSSVEHLIATITGEVESTSTRAVGVTAAELQRLGSLSPREVEVLHHLVDGTSAAEIAATLGITVHTVETHKRRAYAKLDVQSTARAVTLALAGGIGRIAPEPISGADTAASSQSSSARLSSSSNGSPSPPASTPQGTSTT